MPITKQNTTEMMAKAVTNAPEFGIAAKVLHALFFALLAVQYAIGSIMPHIVGFAYLSGVASHFCAAAAICVQQG
jgi:hypothetical protein